MARKYATLLYKDRLIIQEMCKAGKSVSNIAKELGVHRDTIYKEFKRTNMTRENYDAQTAQLGTWRV
ncbi:MAG: helix-turn-helix domain-containing protein [Agathobacter sp.]|nr:helix-turn-helix domain-containing protein [Agathobacter sp.]